MVIRWLLLFLIELDGIKNYQIPTTEMGNIKKSRKKRKNPKTHLHISGFLDGINQLELQQDMVAPDMHTGDGADDDVHLLDGLHQTPVVGKRTLHQVGTLLFEGQQHLNLLDVDFNLWPVKNTGGMPLAQTCLHNPLAQVPSSTHH